MLEIWFEAAARRHSPLADIRRHLATRLGSQENVETDRDRQSGSATDPKEASADARRRASSANSRSLDSTLCAAPHFCSAR